MRILAWTVAFALVGCASQGTHDDEAREREHVREVEIEREREVAHKRKIVQRRVQALRIAVDTLVEADREDAAHVVEMSLHAHEMKLEGRRDAEAKEVYEAAPRGEHLGEALELAEEILRDQRKPDRAHLVSAVHEEIVHEHRGKRRRQPRTEADERLRHALERIEQLQEQQHMWGERIERLEMSLAEAEERLAHARRQIEELTERE